MPPLLYLFFAIVLSLSATAHNSKLRHRNAQVPLNDVGISNRDLFMLPRSNTSDGNSLNMNSKREVVKRITVTLTIERGLFTAAAYFYSHPLSGVVLDTGSATTWVTDGSPFPTVDPRVMHTYQFEFLGAKLEGYKIEGTVGLQHESLKSHELPESEGLLESRVFFTAVSQSYREATKGYKGGLGLRRSPASWPERNSHELSSTFAFYYGNDKAEFDFSDIREEYQKGIKWYKINKDGRIVEKATIKVGEAVKKVTLQISSGMPYIYGDSKTVEDVYKKKVKKAQLVKGKNGDSDVWMVPCDRQPVASISLGEVNYPIVQTSMPKGKCPGVLQSRPDLGDSFVLAGVSFFRGKYVVFDDEKGLGLLVLKS